MNTNHKRIIVPAMLAVLLLALLAVFTGCEELGYPAPSATPEAAPQADKPSLSGVVSTKNDVQMAVYQHLLEQAASPEAKTYLADFYAACDNWTATSEVFRDGSGTWHAQVDMTAAANWPHRPYWQQAGWYVFKDGRVMPSSLFKANALRIESDLQALSAAEGEEVEEEE